MTENTNNELDIATESEAVATVRSCMKSVHSIVFAVILIYSNCVILF